MKIQPLTLRFAPTGDLRRRYLIVLDWAFAFFSGVRVLTYLPTIWSIHVSGHSDQHSLVTWVGWLGANLTMAAWLHHKNGARFDRAVAVSAANALMCSVTTCAIAYYR